MTKGEEQMAEQTIYSTHILMFPFIFSKDTETVNNALMNNKLWNYETFDAGESSEKYNEYIYFYEYVRKALYSKEPLTSKQTSYHFDFKEPNGKYILEVKDNKYELEVGKISMRTFNTGVGILSISLLNTRYHDPKSVLIINDFARRIYPQFLGKENGIDDVKNELLPQSITLEFDKKMVEDFTYYSDMKNVSKDATNLPKFIHELLGNEFSSHAENGKIHIEPIIDDRMFVISMYMNDALANQMKTYEASQNKYHYEDNSFWYKYVFVDGGDKTCQSKHMTRSLIKDTTYDRWVEWGTLFGISRYSFVALTGSRYGKNRLEPHMRTIYYQMFTLLLAYRASILRFSHRISELTIEEPSIDELQDESANIYKDYINFQNNLFFREITAQEQGIELYTKAMQIMNIEKQLKDLDAEIAELHTYVSIKSEKSRNDRLGNITELGAVFLPPSLLTGVYGSNIVEFAKSETSLWIGSLSIVSSAVLGYAMMKFKWKVSRILAGGLLLGLILFSLFCFPSQSKAGDNEKISNKGEICQIIK